MNQNTIRYSDMRRYFFAFLILLGWAHPSFATSNKLKNIDYCKDATRSVEQRMSIPSNLLRAISLTESGRWIEANKANIAWPWTVTSGGSGQFFPTKRDAIRHVKKLQADGVTNIDVGCMQINMRYHPTAFKNLNEAFDPYKNAQYAGTFLSQLFAQTKSWTAAAGRYHSAEPKRNMYYREKVMAYWNHANEESHEARTVAYKKSYQPTTRVTRDNNRMTALNNTFRQRLSAQRQAMKRAEKMQAQISEWRNGKHRGNTINAAIAKQRALHQQKQKKLLTVSTDRNRNLPSKDFAQRRAAQLEKWRRTTAKPELLAQNELTTTPTTLLD